MEYAILTLEHAILTMQYAILTMECAILTLHHAILTMEYAILTMGYAMLTQVEQLVAHLKGLPDLERALARVHYGTPHQTRPHLPAPSTFLHPTPYTLHPDSRTILHTH